MCLQLVICPCPALGRTRPQPIIAKALLLRIGLDVVCDENFVPPKGPIDKQLHGGSTSISTADFTCGYLVVVLTACFLLQFTQPNWLQLME